MPALDRAIALPEVNDRAMGVGQNLHLDVPRSRDVPLQEDRTITKRPLRFRAGLFNPLQ